MPLSIGGNISRNNEDSLNILKLVKFKVRLSCKYIDKKLFDL